MFEIFRKNRINKYTTKASEYLEQNFILDSTAGVGDKNKKPPRSDDGIRYSLRDDYIQYSDRRSPDISIDKGDTYDSKTVSKLMQNYNLSSASTLLKSLEKTTNKTFVDTLIVHINRKGMRDSEVYKAAQIDRRLFSKIMSDREYKPAKDTAIALAVALKLTLEETNDLLSRAGYTFSHSNKKDIIIEYFFRERIYKLDDINQVLFNLDQKIIGR